MDETENNEVELVTATFHGVNVSWPKDMDDWSLDAGEAFAQASEGGLHRATAFLAALLGPAKWSKIRPNVKTVRDARKIIDQVIELSGLGSSGE